ncbi:hypothetical protein M2410_001147 [Stenotrophomonas chelatiphaga]|uniref:hypothetical protein n=1 Tax=Stenotrophomonas chelatiphaga TaxID=517011 RepID=UPI0011CD9E45|nr:hypothetical protein [Stenotrophomonas chelatiphaga]MCS4230423.1 hypothetical protein [Stenotrophomonas chelatiphaga]
MLHIADNEGADMAGILDEITYNFGPPMASTLYHHSYDTVTIKVPPTKNANSADGDLSTSDNTEPLKESSRIGIKIDSIKTALARVVPRSEKDE